jgi:large subunit ribosomal protein L21
VRAGGRQEKVEVGTVVVLDRIKADKDGNIELAAVLLVDGDKITHDAKSLANVTVTGEVVGDLRGPKIVIQKFKNKTGYKKRQGHRQELTRVKITGIK